MRISWDTTLSELNDNLTHSDGIEYVDLDENELAHFKYIKREKVNGKWRYYYEDDLNNESKGTIASDYVGARFESNTTKTQLKNNGTKTQLKANGAKQNKLLGQTFVQKKLAGTAFKPNSIKQNKLIGKNFVEKKLLGNLIKSNSSSQKKLVGRSISNKSVGTRFESNSAKRYNHK